MTKTTKAAEIMVDEPALRVRVSARMVQLGLNQTQVAKLSGFSQGKLSDWLAGSKKIRVDSLARILQAVALGLLVSELPGFQPSSKAKARKSRRAVA